MYVGAPAHVPQPLKLSLSLSGDHHYPHGHQREREGERDNRCTSPWSLRPGPWSQLTVTIPANLTRSLYQVTISILAVFRLWALIGPLSPSLSHTLAHTLSLTLCQVTITIPAGIVVPPPDVEALVNEEDSNDVPPCPPPPLRQRGL